MTPVLHTVLPALLDPAIRTLERGNASLADASRVARFLRGRLEFRPRHTDIFVVSYPRSGTTWMQYILHLLTHDTEFSHIGRVAPWWERSLAVGSRRAAEFEALPSPRVFKSHLPYRWLPRRGRLIYLVRDGRDVAASYFHLYRSHLGFRGTFDEFFTRFLRGELQYRSWFKHVAGWREHAGEARLLWLPYERLRADPQSCVREVARFAGLAADAAVIDRVVDRSRIDAMRAAHEKFDHIGELLADHGIVENAFIRDGRVGSSKLTETQRQAFDEAARRGIRGADLEWRLAGFLH